MLILFFAPLLTAAAGVILFRILDRVPGKRTGAWLTPLLALGCTGAYLWYEAAIVSDPGPLAPVFAVIGICLHPLWILTPLPLFRNRLSSVNPSVVVAATVFTVVAVVTLLNFSSGEVRYIPPAGAAGWAWEIARTALVDLGLATLVYAGFTALAGARGRCLSSSFPPKTGMR
jgi:hypothetical protein